MEVQRPLLNLRTKLRMDNGKPSEEKATTATAPSTSSENRPSGSKWLKIGTGVAAASGFGIGLRLAWKQSRPVDPKALSRQSVLGGGVFALRALGIATLVTVSGYGLFLVGISMALGVNTPRQFGERMNQVFGERWRIAKATEGENYDSLTELLEAVSKAKDEKKAALEAARISKSDSS
ncbi:Protein F28D9.4 [Aphelenchoides avenae]|nr:Protein F28D9.4 [Aphelenchus avenae]